MPESTVGSEEPPIPHVAATVARLRERAARARSLGPQPSTARRPTISEAGEESWEVDRLLRIARIPDAYRRTSWDRVRSRAVQQWAADVGKRAQRRSDVAPVDWDLLGHGLLILGSPGTGKSSAAALCCRSAAAQGRTVRWTYLPDLLDQMTLSARERTEVLRGQRNVDVLVWDDLGVRDMADWEIGFLDQIVEARYQAFRPMIVTSNWTPAEIRSDARMARLVDRWRERTASRVVVLSGESMREQNIRAREEKR